MIDVAQFRNKELRGGFIIAELSFVNEALRDPLGREAAAQTRITGNEFRLCLRANLDGRELSVTLYHEVLEAASVASENPPIQMMDFNESDFEKAAQSMHDRFGEATPEKLNRMLQLHGFGAK